MVGVGGSSPLAPTKVTREHPDESLGAFLLLEIPHPVVSGLPIQGNRV